MRIVHRLFVVGAALFVGGIGFVIASARAAHAAPAYEAPMAAPAASGKQIMKTTVGPAAATVFGAVGTTISFAGTEEKAPRNDKEWQEVENSATALIGAGRLLMTKRSFGQNEEWMKMSQALVAASKVSLAAARARNAGELLASGEALYAACVNCHRM